MQCVFCSWSVCCNFLLRRRILHRVRVQACYVKWSHPITHTDHCFPFSVIFRFLMMFLFLLFLCGILSLFFISFFFSPFVTFPGDAGLVVSFSFSCVCIVVFLRVLFLGFVLLMLHISALFLSSLPMPVHGSHWSCVFFLVC